MDATITTSTTIKRKIEQPREEEPKEIKVDKRLSEEGPTITSLFDECMWGKSFDDDKDDGNNNTRIVQCRRYRRTIDSDEYQGFDMEEVECCML